MGDERLNRALALLFVLLTTAPLAAEELSDDPEGEYQPTVEELGDMVIEGEVDVTAIPGIRLPIEKIPSNIQLFDGEDLTRTQSLSVGEYMNRNLMGVNVNDAQSNPLQPDIRYRGFSASPLLGVPQGLSIYVNGVRFNEPFGDTVNWDLIPEGAIDQMVLHPGSNPIFGLNTLGGAIAIHTKTGFSYDEGLPQLDFSARYGSWDRHEEELTSGWNNGTFGFFLDLRNFGELGWRDHSKSRLNQAMGTFSWRGDEDRASLDLTLSASESDLNGNGGSPMQLYNINPSLAFTHPDNTRNSLFLASLTGGWEMTDQISLGGNLYYRRNDTNTFNGDDSDFVACEDTENSGLVCEEDGDDEALVTDLYGNTIAASDRVIGATNNRSKTHQDGFGGSIQSAFTQDLLWMENQLIIGSSYDAAKINFNFGTELAALTFARGTIGSGVLVGESEVNLKASTSHWGFFVTDTLSVTDALAITLAARYNNSTIRMEDRFGTELNGDHFYDRFNPAAGFTYTVMPEFTFYGGYNESSRAPTPVELSCADPDAPCKLPNAFLSDPPLKQVVAKTFEAGFKGVFEELWDGYLAWNVGFYNTRNYDDIQFINAGNLTNEGYFTNVGTTRRRGVELGFISEFEQLFSDFDNWRFSASYSFIDATYQSPFIASSPNNPSAAADGTITVGNGAHLPGIPSHMVKLSADMDLWDHFSLGMDMLYNSSQVYRGDEANLNDRLAGFTTVNLRAEYRFNQYVALFGKVDNLLDKRYQTFGLYGDASDVLGDHFYDPRFVSPGAPRAGWLGIRLSL